MYQTIFDYDKEFRIYDTYLKKYKGKKKILELGCGSGNLGHRLVQAKYDYLGVDLFPEMLAIAREEFPQIEVQQGDMRSFDLNAEFDVILITGRAFCYLSSNEDVLRCLSCVFAHLKPEGIVIFDNFHAPGIYGDFQTSSEIKTTYQSRTYTRISSTSPNLKTGWTWNWEAKYIIEEGGKTQEFQDTTLLRAFTEDELQLFLNLCGFQVLESKKESFEIWTVALKKEPIKNVIKSVINSKEMYHHSEPVE
jgi:SAM-dependent methyltransferase